MDLEIKGGRRSASRRVCALLVPMLMVAFSGCKTMNDGGIPATEYDNFVPKAVDKRIMNLVKLRWEVRDDVTQYCAQSLGMGREQANLTPPVACAIWHVKNKECVIVTGNPTSHVALGHEVRHCFEGQFH